MSGLCATWNATGAPVDRALLEAMTAAQAHRGPDGIDLHRAGAAGLGHALLAFDAASSRTQPCSLDGDVWVVADARIDDQARLRGELVAAGRIDVAAAGDAELILHAYHAWGDLCVEHLLGDFAFAIWDGARGTWLCARDHFGVKPLFYAHGNDHFACASEIAALRLDPHVSAELDDRAIAEFLLFDGPRGAESTSFRDIRRLPPGHALSVDQDGLRAWPYWRMPTDVDVVERTAAEYIDGFVSVFGLAVADRLRGQEIAVEMSGGLDSTSVAAMARRVLAGQGRTDDALHAYTIVYDRLIPDDERHFASLAAEALRLRHRLFAVDDHALFERYESVLDYMPEPVNDPTGIISADVLGSLPQSTRVVLTGWDGDGALSEPAPGYLRALWRQGKRTLVLARGLDYLRVQAGRGPLHWAGWLGRRLRRKPSAPHLPEWIAEELVRSLGLAQPEAPAAASGNVGSRPYAYSIFAGIQAAPGFFDGYDPAYTGRALEFRHPFMDRRVLEYCLSLPAYPWCYKKRVLRDAFTELPAAVRQREKAPLAGYPHVALLATQSSRWIDQFVASPDSARYIDRAKVPTLVGDTDPDSAWTNLRPLSLDLWLRRQANGRNRGTTP